MAQLFRTIPSSIAQHKQELTHQNGKKCAYSGKNTGLKPKFLRSDLNSALTISVALDNHVLQQLLY